MSDNLSSDPSALWQATLRDLSSQVSRANYDTWLDGTEGLRFEGNSLVVGTRSEFVTEWLQQRLKPSILRSLSEISGQSFDVFFNHYNLFNPQLKNLTSPHQTLTPHHALDSASVTLSTVLS